MKICPAVYLQGVRGVGGGGGAARRGTYLGGGYKWEMGGGVVYLGWTVCGAERAHGLCALLPLLFFLPVKSENINGNCERGCKGMLIPKKSSLIG